MITDQIKTTLANHIEASLVVQGYHWNVEGINFSEYHSLFGEIYSDYYAQVDTLAEYIRILSSSKEYVNASIDILKVNKTLKTLNFKSNLLRDQTGKAILEALNNHNKFIFKIELCLNQISFSILEQINVKISHNESKDA